MSSSPIATVYLSYSRKDLSWADRLTTHLQSLSNLDLEIWDDRRIAAGDAWNKEIAAAIGRARIAILLVSPAFLASVFIQETEVPQQLKRRQAGELTIIPVIVEPCAWQEIPWLASIQVLPRDARPLSLLPAAEIDAALAAIVREVAGQVSSVTKRASPSFKAPAPKKVPAPKKKARTPGADRTLPAQPAAGSISPADLDRMTDGTRMCFRVAATLAREVAEGTLDPILLLAACALHGTSTQGPEFYAPRFLADCLRQQKASSDVDLISALGLPARYGITSAPQFPLPEIPEALFHGELARAFRLADRLREETCRDKAIHARHLVVALLAEIGTTEDPPLQTPAYLREAGFDVEELRTQFLGQILQNVPEDNLAAWEDILGERSRQAPSRPVPGYVSDAAGGRDQLGIAGEVNALCSVTMAREFKPPLSIGLFGDWGSGKSFFMEMMRDRITKLAACALESEEAGKPTSYCSHVAQITFNAWHYIDADLWASLVTKIWEDLARFISQTHPNPEAGQRMLQEQLKVGTERVAEAERMALEAEGKRRELEGRIANLEEERGKQSDKLRPGAIVSFVFDRPEVREPLTAAANEIGLSAANAATRDTVSTLAGLAGRVRTLALWVRQGPSPGKRLALLALPVLIAAVVAGGMYWLLRSQGGTIQKAVAALSALAALLVQAATWLRPWIEKIRSALSQLEKAREQIDQAAEKRREEIRKLQESLQQELDRLRVNEAALQRRLTVGRERIQRLEEEIRKAEGPRDVGEFVQTQAISEEYQGRLGFLARVRRDFDRLSQLMMTGDGNSRQEPTLPRIDRIVLYVDDLDRCPGDRVVQVLEAVHLLLAMPLFVVVVGVDPRWLLRSLEEHYSEFLVAKDSHAGLLDEDEISDWASTPLHYLEKIFQIPFTLQPMGSEGFTRLVRTMVEAPPSSARAAESVPTPADDQLEAHGSPTAEGVAPEPIEAPGAEHAPPTSPSPEPPPPLSATPAGEPRIDPRPPALEITPDEVKFMSQLAALIRSPRSAKRFVNIYRLIRAQLDRRELYYFVGRDDVPGEHQAVLVLLAILIGFPDEASYLLRALRERDHGESWWALIDGLTPTPLEVGKFRNSVRMEIDDSELRGWNKLHGCLSGLKGKIGLPDQLAPYQKWVAPVARFSFKSGRVISGAGA